METVPPNASLLSFNRAKSAFALVLGAGILFVLLSSLLAHSTSCLGIHAKSGASKKHFKPNANTTQNNPIWGDTTMLPCVMSMNMNTTTFANSFYLLLLFLYLMWFDLILLNGKWARNVQDLNCSRALCLSLDVTARTFAFFLKFPIRCLVFSLKYT